MNIRPPSGIAALALTNLGLFLSSLVGATAAVETPEALPFRDAQLPVEARVNDLLSRLTLEEKALQLVSGFPLGGSAAEMPSGVGLARSLPHFSQKTKRLSPAAAARQINDVQQQAITGSRLGIPILFNEESLHGACWGDATVFPQAIGLGATWNENLMADVARAIARELRAVGVRQTLAPVINIARDPRWGRTEETFGEDPWLTARMGLAYVSAMEKGGVVATPKHFVANYGAGGRDSFEVYSSERYLREVDLFPFEVAIREGRARSIMAAYNSIDGVPCAVHPWLLTSLLRHEWGFEGIVVGDYSAVEGVETKHGIDQPDLVSRFFTAGLDVDLPTGESVLKAYRQGTLQPALLDRSVARLLRLKFELGLFEEAYVDAAAADFQVATPEHVELARQAARESIVLLQNTGGTLPLDRRGRKTLVVIGPDHLPLGGYTGTMGGQWEGRRAKLSDSLSVLAPDSRIICLADHQQLGLLPPETAAAVFIATIKEGEGLDRSGLSLPESQEQAILSLAERGIPTVVLLCTGAPVTLERWIKRAAAVLQVWYPGQEGARAVAEVLTGIYNPAGRLPMTFPKHIGQVPIHYSTRPSGRDLNNYSDDDGQPRFPFGFGLSYTRFGYSGAAIDRTAIRPGDQVLVSINVRNEGQAAGDEVVQLYVRHSQLDISTVRKELRAFRRIHLQPGETRTVTFPLGERELSTVDSQLRRRVQPGKVHIMLGRSSDDVAASCQLTIKE